MQSPNEFLVDLIRLADEHGWLVLGFKGTKPCSITLMDARGTEVTLTDEWGLSFKEYLAELTPLAKRSLKVKSDV